ncbi:SMAD/FHA domain-containing protein [Clohesyomyces aquaticus]|uniref:SMAD/FHA domain-containing protein n=1 Tax=Clohesyomyces aquaticus TaxID=1231657 RepID=A0A1Y1Y7K6_9PLEO|nr:SMAD/FHA domain-containing protein [Clohesyomyces aquaticus]
MQRSTGSPSLGSQQQQHDVERIASSPVGESPVRCLICLDDLQDECEARPCGHDLFHFICLVTWLEHRAACPLCNGDINEVRYEVSGNDKQGKIYKVPESNKGSDASSRLPLRYEDNAVQKRRRIYRDNLYSLHIGSNEQQLAESAYKELSPQLLATDARLISRARAWLRRELRVFQFLNTARDFSQDRRPSNMEFLADLIIAMLKTVDFQDSSGHAEGIIQEYLGRRNTQLFLHELKAWLRSPYESLSAWDLNVQYREANTLPRASNEPNPEAMQCPTVILKYSEPAGARKPCSTQAWRLYVFKDSEIVDTINLSERSVWLFGRDERVVDVVTGHPSCSGQHAVLQFLYLPAKICRKQGGEKREWDRKEDGHGGSVGLYLIDQDSTHGTRLNGEAVESGRYVEIKDKDLIQFGGSRREYVVILPPA